jgi:hypothetical protein
LRVRRKGKAKPSPAPLAISSPMPQDGALMSPGAAANIPPPRPRQKSGGKVRILIEHLRLLD